MEFDENLFKSRITALKRIADNFLYEYDRAITDPQSQPKGELLRKANLFKSSLEKVYSDLLEIMQ